MAYAKVQAAIIREESLGEGCWVERSRSGRVISGVCLYHRIHLRRGYVDGSSKIVQGRNAKALWKAQESARRQAMRKVANLLWMYA